MQMLRVSCRRYLFENSSRQIGRFYVRGLRILRLGQCTKSLKTLLGLCVRGMERMGMKEPAHSKL